MNLNSDMNRYNSDINQFNLNSVSGKATDKSQDAQTKKTALPIFQKLGDAFKNAINTIKNFKFVNLTGIISKKTDKLPQEELPIQYTGHYAKLPGGKSEYDIIKTDNANDYVQGDIELPTQESSPYAKIPNDPDSPYVIIQAKDTEQEDVQQFNTILGQLKGDDEIPVNSQYEQLPQIDSTATAPTPSSGYDKVPVHSEYGQLFADDSIEMRDPYQASGITEQEIDTESVDNPTMEVSASHVNNLTLGTGTFVLTERISNPGTMTTGPIREPTEEFQ